MKHIKKVVSSQYQIVLWYVLVSILPLTQKALKVAKGKATLGNSICLKKQTSFALLYSAERETTGILIPSSHSEKSPKVRSTDKTQQQVD